MENPPVSVKTTVEAVEPINTNVPQASCDDAKLVKQDLEQAELALREDHINFREYFEFFFGIDSYEEHGKVGMVYLDPKGNHTQDVPLRYAFSNQRFIDCFIFLETK